MRRGKVHPSKGSPHFHPKEAENLPGVKRESLHRSRLHVENIGIIQISEL